MHVLASVLDLNIPIHHLFLLQHCHQLLIVQQGTETALTKPSGKPHVKIIIRRNTSSHYLTHSGVILGKMVHIVDSRF